MRSTNDNMIIENMLAEGGGFVTAAQITDAGLQRRALSELVSIGRVYRVSRGVYALPETWEDEMYSLQYRFAKGVFSGETALYLHGLTDRTPHFYTLTFPHGYNAASLKKTGAKAKFVIADIYDLGVAEAQSSCGNPLRVYDAERTLCDIVKGGGCDIQIVNQAMKTYAASKSKDVAKLMSYAERLRVKPKILRYMEVLL